MWASESAHVARPCGTPMWRIACTLLRSLPEVASIPIPDPWELPCRCMTIAGAVAHFYFARGQREKMPRSPLWSAFSITLVYHLGTVAIGSFILALLIFVRMALQFIQRRTTLLTRGRIGNSWIKYLFSCLALVLWLIEKIVKFINRCPP